MIACVVVHQGGKTLNSFRCQKKMITQNELFYNNIRRKCSSMRRRKSCKKNGVFVIQINYDTRREFEKKKINIFRKTFKQKERKVVIVVIHNQHWMKYIYNICTVYMKYYYYIVRWPEGNLYKNVLRGRKLLQIRIFLGDDKKRWQPFPSHGDFFFFKDKEKCFVWF